MTAAIGSCIYAYLQEKCRTNFREELFGNKESYNKESFLLFSMDISGIQSFPGEVSFYVCGPTVYDYFHIGNARPFVVFDVLRRYMESKGLRVKYIQNFTDIDDKMIQRAYELGVFARELACRYIDAYYEDADGLGIRRATENPCATAEIPAIIDLIERLVFKEHAYKAGKDVY